jgi:hypothetical protein
MFSLSSIICFVRWATADKTENWVAFLTVAIIFALIAAVFFLRRKALASSHDMFRWNQQMQEHSEIVQYLQQKIID